jgi:hypothetical protein
MGGQAYCHALQIVFTIIELNWVLLKKKPIIVGSVLKI